MNLDIGSQLDTIAKLLAGAPPGPEEKFLFQKYVYCKEDYTSWVVSLLGELGIAYTQVDSLVNGLYEYRCEATNDQFNQVILKVELSQNPVLATYKKIDSFSDLIGINVFDMDSFAAGCNSRISKSDTITADMIKYWLNVQNGQIVQRQIDLSGSASIGTYSIDFTGGNVIGGSVPVNGSIRDNILYRKQITGSAFDYSLTNCTIEGWIIDYDDNVIDLSGKYTEVVCTGTPPITNSFDDDLITGTDTGNLNSTGTFTTFWEVSFPLCNVKDIHTKFYLYDYGSTVGTIRLQAKINGVWTTVIEVSGGATYYKHYNTSHDLVTGLRYQYKCTGSGANFRANIYDITANYV